ncbi:MAG: lipoprotein signal peptidase [Bacteroidota bacterium]
MNKKKILIIATILIVLIIDQWSKVWVKTNMEYQSVINIFGLERARIFFVENDGMAFGLSYGGVTGKYILSVFRILMAGFLGYLLYGLWKADEKKSLIFSFSLIVAGAIGNIIDCIFYGQIFSESQFHSGLSKFVKFGEGYAPLLQGKVVDMLHFPIIQTQYPSWFPFFGGKDFEFFSPIFNVADSAITVGVISILLFNREFFLSNKSQKQNTQTEEIEAND